MSQCYSAAHLSETADFMSVCRCCEVLDVMGSEAARQSGLKLHLCKKLGSYFTFKLWKSRCSSLRGTRHLFNTTITALLNYQKL